MTAAQRQKRYRTRLKRKTRQSRPKGSGVAHPHYRGYRDFVPAFTAARLAAIAVYGERWSLILEAYVWARLPKAWTTARTASSGPGQLGAPIRDHKLPVARFWPKGRLPIGPDYADAAVPTPLAAAAE
jgi:hypothetical protein